MLAKPLNLADGRRVTKTLNTESRLGERSDSDGGTASVKRRQGSDQAAGRFALSLRLKQPRKSQKCEADLVTSGGRQHSYDRDGKVVRVPPGSSKIVACLQRSEADEPHPELGIRSEAPRTREALSRSLWKQVVRHQLEEEADGSEKEPDPPIVVS